MAFSPFLFPFFQTPLFTVVLPFCLAQDFFHSIFAQPLRFLKPGRNLGLLLPDDIDRDLDRRDRTSVLKPV